MKKHLLLFLLVFSTYLGCSQSDIPDSYALETVEDYTELEGKVLESLKYLLNTPLDQEMPVRAEQNAFVMIWLAGSPEIELLINSKAMPFLDADENLMFTFIHGMAWYKLKHQKETDEIVLHAEGLSAVCKIIEMTESYNVKDKSLRKLLKANRKGRIRTYTDDLLNSEG